MQSFKELQRQQNWGGFTATHPDMATFLASAMKWSNFAKSLVCSIEEFGTLTTGQEAAVKKMMKK